MSILKIENLSHRYSQSWAIKDINLDIDSVGVIGLLGSNGAGKSTMMNIICGALNPTQGTVIINGIDLKKEREAAKMNLGFLPQTLPLYTDLTVDEYLYYTAELRLMPRKIIPEAVEQAKEKCQLTHFSSRLIKNLSGGYRQRVGIAQSIIHNPRLVIMDEPTTGLDPNQLIEVRKLIREIGQDRTVLLSSHIMSEIHQLCREVIMVERGRVIFSDSMDTFQNYLQPSSMMLQFGNPPEDAELLAIEGINKITVLGNNQFRVSFGNQHQLAERIVEASVIKGWKLQHISVEKGVLDDVFKELSEHSLEENHN